MKSILCACLLSLAPLVYGDWTPPANPDPDKIFQEVKEDRTARRYDDAVAKHVWYHKNALQYKPGLAGVRLSFALSEWIELGAVHPPALEKLKALRDEAEKSIRESKAQWDAFHDFQSINKHLEEDSRTSDLFVWLDANRPELAKRAYQIAQPTLIKAGAVELCGKYIDAEAFKQMAHIYQLNLKMARDPKFGENLQTFADKSFAVNTTTLVALLVRNKREAEADRVMKDALKEMDSASFKDQMKKARRGEVPAQWP